MLTCILLAIGAVSSASVPSTRISMKSVVRAAQTISCSASCDPSSIDSAVSVIDQWINELDLHGARSESVFVAAENWATARFRGFELNSAARFLLNALKRRPIPILPVSLHQPALLALAGDPRRALAILGRPDEQHLLNRLHALDRANLMLQRVRSEVATLPFDQPHWLHLIRRSILRCDTPNVCVSCRGCQLIVKAENLMTDLRILERQYSQLEVQLTVSSEYSLQPATEPLPFFHEHVLQSASVIPEQMVRTISEIETLRKHLREERLAIVESLLNTTPDLDQYLEISLRRKITGEVLGRMPHFDWYAGHEEVHLEDVRIAAELLSGRPSMDTRNFVSAFGRNPLAQQYLSLLADFQIPRDVPEEQRLRYMLREEILLTIKTAEERNEFLRSLSGHGASDEPYSFTVLMEVFPAEYNLHFKGADWLIGKRVKITDGLSLLLVDGVPPEVVEPMASKAEPIDPCPSSAPVTLAELPAVTTLSLAAEDQLEASCPPREISVKFHNGSLWVFYPEDESLLPEEDFHDASQMSDESNRPPLLCPSETISVEQRECPIKQGLEHVSTDPVDLHASADEVNRHASADEVHRHVSTDEEPSSVTLPLPDVPTDQSAPCLEHVTLIQRLRDYVPLNRRRKAILCGAALAGLTLSLRGHCPTIMPTHDSL